MAPITVCWKRHVSTLTKNSSRAPMRALLRRRHAEYYLNLFQPAESEREFRPQAEWLANYGRHIDNARTSLDWAFSPDGDPQTGVALTIAVVPLWTELSLLGECRERVEQALASLDSRTASGGASANATFGGAWLVTDVRRRSRPRIQRCVGDHPETCRRARRYALPAARPLGPVHRSIQQRESQHCTGIRPPFRRPCRQVPPMRSN